MGENINWSLFKRRIILNKNIEEVYNAWTIPSKIEEWFLERAEYSRKGEPLEKSQNIQKGDSFEWKWNNWDTISNGNVLEANGKNKISFTFGVGGNVDIELTETELGTELILTQRDIPTDDVSKKELFVGCTTGWTFWLTNLKAWLEHGITLNVKGLSQNDTYDLGNS